MSVLHPTLLAAGLAAIALPILIHLLLRRRYVPIRWAAMRFVMEAQKQQRRRRKLEQILLLIARCVLIALIALAVARPLLGSAGSDRERTLVLVIDNSLASGSVDAEGVSDLDRSKRLALDEIDTLRPAMGDRVAVFASASPPRPIIATPTGDLDAVRSAIESIDSADSIPDFAGTLSLANAALRGPDSGTNTPSVSDNATIVLVSAWRSGSVDGAAASRTAPTSNTISGADDATLQSSAGSSSNYILSPPAEDERSNLRILDIAIPRGVLLVNDTPAVRQAIVRIDRTGPTGDEVTAELVCEIRSGASTTTAESVSFTIPAGQRETAVAIGLPEPSPGEDRESNASVASFSLNATPAIDSIASDSTRSFTIRVAQTVEAGLVRSRGIRDDDAGIPTEAWAAAALQPDESSPVRVREIAHSGLDATSLIGLDLVVLAHPELMPGAGWAALETFVREGGSLLVFAPPLEGSHPWVDDAAARFTVFDGLGREGEQLDAPEPLVIASAGPMLGLLGAELEDLAGAVRVNRTLPLDTEPSRIVLASQTGRPVLAQPADRLWVVTTAISPEWSDLAARPIFPALMQEIARKSPARGVGMTSTAGEPISLPPNAARIESSAASVQASTPTDEAGWALGLSQGGVYTVRGRADETLGLLAVNPDPEGGDTGVGSKTSVEASLAGLDGVENFRWIGDETSNAETRLSNTSISLWLFAGAVLLAIVETLIAASATKRGTSTNAARPTTLNTTTPRNAGSPPSTRTGAAA